MAKDKKIKTFKDLYDYFQENEKTFSFERVPCDGSPAIKVVRIGTDGKPEKFVIEDPEKHLQLAMHIFKGIEVLNPGLTIPEVTMVELVKKLSMSPDIFDPVPYI